MKKFLSLSLLLFSFILLIMDLPMPAFGSEFHSQCDRVNKTQSFNYLGKSLTSTSEDPTELSLCPGDAFGDLNETYVKIQDCNLVMYHKDNMIWSKGRRDFQKDWIDWIDWSNDDDPMCGFYLKRDGNLVLYQDGIFYENNGSDWPDWLPRTHFDPIKTELRVRDQQLQIIRTFRDGTQRLFFIDEIHQDFAEGVMGRPIKMADKFISKSHQDEDKTILSRNEYIGDLNGTHLILQINCELQLQNKNEIVWSIRLDFESVIPCALNVAQDNTIEISRIWMNFTFSGSQSVMKSKAYFEPVESKITFDDHEPIIIQTLKDGSQLTFYGGRLKIEEFTQIARKTLKVKGTRFIERMEYVGNLTGLHLVLDQNCCLILANGKEKLWEFQIEPPSPHNAVIECKVELNPWDISLQRYPSWPQPLLEHSFSFSRREFPGTELSLENDQILFKVKHTDRDHPGQDHLDMFYDGRQTNGTFLHLIAQNSIVVDHTYSYTEILPKRGFIGDLNGVYALLDNNCNLVLKNNTRLLWESGTFLDRLADGWQSCGLGLHADGQVKISYQIDNYQRKTIWSALDFPPQVNFGQVLKAEFSVSYDELWLIYTFKDGTAYKEKAMKGTNRFTNNLTQSQLPYHFDLEKITFCKERNTTQSLSYLTSNSDDLKDVVLCPGDTFGDLNETYIEVKNCYLAMYHKNKTIWTSKIDPNDMHDWSEKYACAFSINRNGDLVLYKEDSTDLSSGPTVTRVLWQAQLNPVRTDLRIQDQQIKIIYTLRNGTQKSFFADENHQEFIEDLGEPVKVAGKFIIKSHEDEDRTILRRNEYIGDLNGTHLILQINCDLQLLNKKKVLWSFIPPFRHQMNCTLNIAEDNIIEISSLLTEKRTNIMKSQKSLEVVKSQITFEGDQPIIIQTLKNGSQLVFSSEPGLNYGLNLKRELKQIAQKTIITEKNYFIERLNYIGNLSGLHLILEQNCSLILANGNHKLWEFQSEFQYVDEPLMECSLVFYHQSGEIHMIKEWASQPSHLLNLLRCRSSSRGSYLLPGIELTLENDQMKIKCERSNQDLDIFYASAITSGAFFRFVARSSVIINSGDDLISEILPKLGYIGDLNGVYTILDKYCNWVLYNKTQIIWESGTSGIGEYGECILFKAGNRNIGIYGTDWFAFRSSLEGSLFKEVLQTEVLVNNSGLWLIYTFQDGTGHKYQAIPGTNGFELVSKTYDFSFGSEL